MLCLFATFVAKTVQHASIKVYLSGIRALHIDQGFSDPLAGCLRLRQVLRGIKRCQGFPVASRLPITDDLMLVIWNSLDLSLPDHCEFGLLAVLDILVSSAHQNSPYQTWLIFPHHSILVSKILAWTPWFLHPV